MTDDQHPPAARDHRFVLGVSSGRPAGSAEILLRAALGAARDAGARVELVRLDELRLPTVPRRSGDAAADDDVEWLWEKLIACDGLVVSTPIMTRTMDASLKVVVDRLLGPNADAAIIEELTSRRQRGEEVNVPFRVDERVLKPRVAGFLAVGGSLTERWKTLTLPLLHTLTFSMHIAVVDQIVFEGAGTPQSIVLDDDAVDRAAALGRAVAAQLGTPFDDAVYVGQPGACPMCHLDVIALRGHDVECATCGAQGVLAEDRTIRWTDLDTSVLSMAEKHAHAVEIQETAALHAAQADTIAARVAALDDSLEPTRP